MRPANLRVDQPGKRRSWQTATQKRQNRVSPKRLEQAREEGDVPRSRELATFYRADDRRRGLWITGGSLVRPAVRTMVSGLSLDREQVFNPTC
jgi:flagellar biosynthesis protein FlhB